jgi:hypothetical protein
MKMRVSLFFLMTVLALAAFDFMPNNRVMDTSDDRSLDGFEALGTLNRLQVLYAANNGTIYAMEDAYVYSSTDGGQTFREIGRVPKSVDKFGERVKDWVARLRITRLVRGNRGPSNLVVLDSGTILVFWDHIYRSTDGGRTFKSVFDFSGGTIHPPFPYSPGVSVGPEDSVYFGEYQYRE